MEDHVRTLLQHFQCSGQFKETAVFRIVLGTKRLDGIMNLRAN